MRTAGRCGWKMWPLTYGPRMAPREAPPRAPRKAPIAQHLPPATSALNARWGDAQHYSAGPAAAQNHGAVATSLMLKRRALGIKHAGVHGWGSGGRGRGGRTEGGRDGRPSPHEIASDCPPAARAGRGMHQDRLIPVHQIRQTQHFAGAVRMALVKRTLVDVMSYAVPVMLGTVRAAEKYCQHTVGLLLHKRQVWTQSDLGRHRDHVMQGRGGWGPCARRRSRRRPRTRSRWRMRSG